VGSLVQLKFTVISYRNRLWCWIG